MAASTLVDELRSARWFGGKSRPIRAATVIDRARLASDAALCLVDVEYEGGASDTYVLVERIDDPAVARAMLNLFSGALLPTERGCRLVFTPTHLLHDVPSERTEPIRLLQGEQSNSSVLFGDALILKLFRRFHLGPNPEVEIGRFLADHSDFHGTPAVLGSLEYQTTHMNLASIALLQAFQPNRGDAWRTTLARLQTVLDGADAAPSIAALARLGETTGALHVALAQPGGGPEFDPEPIVRADLDAWRAAIHAELDHVVSALNLDARALYANADGIDALHGALKTRHHGDYHLGQVLEAPDGNFVIIDFEGEPSKPLHVRREKRSPLRDVAGMLRSFDYARHAALRAGNAADPVRQQRAEAWYLAVREAFLAAYFGVVRAEPRLLPGDVETALHALELEKATYEVLYELNNRPDWLPIPLAALK